LRVMCDMETLQCSLPVLVLVRKLRARILTQSQQAVPHP
jgi:hypothetical protein